MQSLPLPGFRQSCLQTDGPACSPMALPAAPGWRQGRNLGEQKDHSMLPFPNHPGKSRGRNMELGLKCWTGSQQTEHLLQLRQPTLRPGANPVTFPALSPPVTLVHACPCMSMHEQTPRDTHNRLLAFLRRTRAPGTDPGPCLAEHPWCQPQPQTPAQVFAGEGNGSAVASGMLLPTAAVLSPFPRLFSLPRTPQTC